MTNEEIEKIKKQALSDNARKAGLTTLKKHGKEYYRKMAIHMNGVIKARKIEKEATKAA